MKTQIKSQAINALLADEGTRLLMGVLALSFGALLVFGTGFAHPEVLHNAAHDARHAFGFPCH